MSILLIYPIGAGGEFIGCTVNPNPSKWFKNENLPEINRYYYKGNAIFPPDQQRSKEDYETYNDFINVESHHFSLEGWRSWADDGWNVHSESAPNIQPRENYSPAEQPEEIGFTGYIYTPLFFADHGHLSGTRLNDLLESENAEAAAEIESYDSQPILQYQYTHQADIKDKVFCEPGRTLGTPILILHNHFNIHKFFKDIKAYGLISNNFALRLVWTMAGQIKQNPHLWLQTGGHFTEGLDNKYTIEWMNALGELDGDYYLDLETKDKPLYEDYKARIKQDDIELITPAELDLIDEGLANKYKVYTERNVEVIKEKLPDYNFKWIDRIEYT